MIYGSSIEAKSRAPILVLPKCLILCLIYFIWGLWQREARAEVEPIFGFCFEERESSYQAGLIRNDERRGNSR